MKNTLYFCWVISLIGCVISLYYGEILMLEPCRLCWYQRLALFPLALILGLAVYHNDAKAVRYALPLCLFGAAAAFYQAVGTHFPHLDICSGECAKTVVSFFGLISWPDLNAIVFAAMGIWLFLFSRLVNHIKIQ